MEYLKNIYFTLKYDNSCLKFVKYKNLMRISNFKKSDKVKCYKLV